MTSYGLVGSKLGLHEESLGACVGCGLCLPHCPTYRVTGDERRSPRGRIALMRIVDSGLAEANDEWFAAMDTCIQCRGCESACPSAVPFGDLIATTRSSTLEAHPPPRRVRVGLWILTRPRWLRICTVVLALLQRIRLLDWVGALPPNLPIRARTSNAEVSGDVILFTGCVMDTWMPHIHDATQRVIEETGTKIKRSGSDAGCCGALHQHAGLASEAKSFAMQVINATRGDQKILVNSAGCGAMLKEYADLLGTEEAKAFSARVFDVHEWLAERLDRLPVVEAKGPPVVVQDPCHLRHVQEVERTVRSVLRAFVPLVELDDDGLCCGAGGSFALVQPELAKQVRMRKELAIDSAIERSGAMTVVSGNPGCALYLGAAGYQVLHPLEVVDAQLAAFKRSRSDSGA